eukprot:21273-Eustigmatos_ZCMA.PRE.1
MYVKRRSRAQPLHRPPETNSIANVDALVFGSSRGYKFAGVDGQPLPGRVSRPGGRPARPRQVDSTRCRILCDIAIWT